MASLPPVHIEKNLFLQMSEKNLERLRNPSSFGNVNSEKKIELTTKEHPLGRIGKVTDISTAALYFASDDSSWTTGAILPVDGGVSLK